MEKTKKIEWNGMEWNGMEWNGMEGNSNAGFCLLNSTAIETYARAFLSLIRHVARSENLEGRVVRGPKNLGGEQLGQGQNLGGIRPPCLPPSNMPA